MVFVLGANTTMAQDLAALFVTVAEVSVRTTILLGILIRCRRKSSMDLSLQVSLSRECLLHLGWR